MAKIIIIIDKTMNPFSENIPKEQLYNISSDKAVSQKTTNFLFTCKQIVWNAREKFIEECITDKKRFEKKLSKQKVSPSANESIKFVARSGKGNLVKVRMETDLFGSIMYLAVQRKIDVGEVLTYPLTTIPLSLCHIDGRINKAPTS